MTIQLYHTGTNSHKAEIFAHTSAEEHGSSRRFEATRKVQMYDPLCSSGGDVVQTHPHVSIWRQTLTSTQTHIDIDTDAETRTQTTQACIHTETKAHRHGQ